MQIKQERLKERIERINEMSRDETGGYTRLAFSEKETKARMMAKEMMLEAGLEVEIDAAGNLMGRLYPDNWNEKELHGVIATGSHIDTVRNGGKFDGLLGSIAGIEVAQCLKENHVKLKSPFEVILFTDEEGARFNAGMVGSKVIAGLGMERPLSEYTDNEGISEEAAMQKCGYHPEKLEEAAHADKYEKFVELHIEQGIVLEQESRQIGIVTGIKGPYWIEGSFEGEANHAGGTPMNMRKDAMTAAANYIAEVEKIASRLGDMFVATVGTLKVHPGGINTIPGRVDYTIDIRDTDMERRAQGIREIKEAAVKISDRFHVESTQKCLKDAKAEMMNEAIVDTIEDVCKKRGYTYMRMPSGPFHDTLSMAHICDVGMIVVPSIGGVSHSPYEDTAWDDIFAGAQVLADTMENLVG